MNQDNPRKELVPNQSEDRTHRKGKTPIVKVIGKEEIDLMVEKMRYQKPLIIVYEYRREECQMGDGINIERRVKATIHFGDIHHDPSFIWSSYCYVNTNATLSTENETHRLVDLLNQEEKNRMSSYCKEPNHG